jgi:hypothetical protein
MGRPLSFVDRSHISQNLAQGPFKRDHAIVARKKPYERCRLVPPYRRQIHISSGTEPECSALTSVYIVRRTYGITFISTQAYALGAAAALRPTDSTNIVGNRRVMLAFRALVRPLKDQLMLYTLVVILLVLWLLGAFVVPVGGGLIHILLVVAVIVLVFQLISGRRAL